MAYVVRRARQKPELKGLWEGPAWLDAETLEIAEFHAKSSDAYRPVTHAKCLYDDHTIYVMFRVQDQYVRCTHTEYQGDVSLDSCVEFFVQPRPERGYLNFEINCGGTLLLKYITNSTRTESGFEEFTDVPHELSSIIHIYHSLPDFVFPEIAEPTEWFIEYSVPLSVFEAWVGPLGGLSGQEWRANFYKCAEETSHPHWATWAPIGEVLDFHQPQYFAPIQFE
jgi:cellulose/xylan binding protein with CBM9 domain